MYGSLRTFIRHIGHTNILKYCPANRPFKDIASMDKAIIDTLNSQMAPGDLLYFLGDASMNHKYVLEYFPTLNADIIYVPGNHCKTFKGCKGWQKCREMTLRQVPNIKSFHDELIIDIGRHKVLLNHFPWAEDSDERHGAKYIEYRPKRKSYPGVSFLLFGHKHSLTSERLIDRGLDIGWDPWGRAVALSEVEEIINATT